MTTTDTTAEALLQHWRNARAEADRRHREEMAEADKLYELWIRAQADAAARGAALPTSTWEDRFAALQVLGDLSVRMRRPGDWYVSQDISIGDGAFLTSAFGNGSTPQEAVEDHWRTCTQVPDGKYLVAKRDGDRIHALWDGDAWKTWKPEVSA